MQSTSLLSMIGLIALLSTGGRASDSQIVLAADGRSDYQIVLPDALPRETLDAGLAEVARLVQTAFAVNGFDLPVVREADREPGRPGLYLGGTAFARAAGVDLEVLDGYDYRIKAVGRDIVIAGRDRPSAVAESGSYLSRQDLDQVATAKAAVDFLRDDLGVRFLFPDLGFYLVGWPDGRNIDLAASPALEFLPRTEVRVPADLDRHWQAGLVYNVSRSRNSLYDIAMNRFPLFNTLMHTHSHQRAVPVEAYYDKHPEYFALIGGERFKGVQYCLSNPGFQELNYQYLVNAFNDGYDKVYLGHSDGFRPCQCEACHALYDTGADWTEKLWIFNRDMAQRLYASHPDKVVALVAYTVTERAPPRSFNRFPPNTMLQMCGTNPRDLDKWRDIEIPLGMTAYVYNSTPNQSSRYVPMNTPLSIEAQARRFAQNNIRGIYRDNGGPLLQGLEGPSAYVMGRMWDDPENNRAADLVNEYIEAAYGSAAAPMKRFFDRLYHGIELYANFLGTRLPAWTYQPIAGRGRKFIDDPYQMLGFLFPPRLLDTLDRELRHAERMSAGSVTQQARLALVRRELEWIRLTASVIHLTHAHQVAPGNPALYHALLDAIEARNRGIASWYDERNRTVAVHPAWNRTLFPVPGHNADHLRLAQDGYQSRFRDTSLNWDADAMRAVPPPGARRAIVTPTAASGLDVAGWDAVEPLTLHTVPSAGERGPETRLRLRYDRENLYLRFDGEWASALQDSLAPADGGADLSRHEAFDVYLAPLPGREVYYRFMAGPDGARYDAASGLIADTMHLRYDRDDPEWTGAWSVEQRLDPAQGRWRALFTIPFATLGAELPAAETFWRANFGRNHQPDGEGMLHQVWSGVSGTDDRNAFGYLEFAPMED